MMNDSNLPKAVVVLLTVVTPLSCILNMLLIVTFFQARSRMPPRNIILASLACSDILQAILGYLPEAIYFYLNSNVADGWLCTFIGASVTCLALTSIAHLTLLAVERTISIAAPYSYQILELSRWQCKLSVLSLAWFYGLAMGLPPLFGWSTYAPENSHKARCSIDWKDKSISGKTYLAYLYTFGYFLPMIIMLSCYFISKYKLHKMYLKSRKQFGKRRTSVATMDVSRANKKHDLMTAIMTMLFMVAWTPYAILGIWLSASDTEIPAPIYSFSVMLAKLSTIFNPIVYAIMYSSKFRSEIKHLCRCRTKPLVKLKFMQQTRFHCKLGTINLSPTSQSPSIAL